MTTKEEKGESKENPGGGGTEDQSKVSPPVPEIDHKKACSNPMTGEEEENRAKLGTEPNKQLDTNSGQDSPRGVLDVPISNASDSDSSGNISNSSAINESAAPDGSVMESHSLQWRAMISGLLMRKKSMRRLSTFPPPAATVVAGRRLHGKLARIQSEAGGLRRAEHGGAPSPPPPLIQWKPSWRSFDYQELAAATDNFSSEKLIGKGGHAEVYKGSLPDGQLVAVKRLLTKKEEREEEEERVGDFLSELGIIAHVNHPNAAHLLGFGLDGGLHLVLQFSPHGSLASLLHGSKKQGEEELDWGVRYKIALGVAEGLCYLHQGCHRRIIHRDIKASNILLTQDYQAQISDFGLAKWLPDQWTHHIVFPIEGTFGYLAPEYFMHGVVNEKTDVFAYGVLLLELITGRRAVDSCRQSLVMWAKPLLDANDTKGLVDPVLGDAYDHGEMRNAVSVASMCIHHMSTMRPHMNRVVQLLRGEEGVSSLEIFTGREANPPKKPLLFDACDLEDYTCSRYLNDLNRHKQLALEQ